MTTPEEQQVPQTEVKKVIYVETSIPSFYHEIRTEPAMVAPILATPVQLLGGDIDDDR